MSDEKLNEIITKIIESNYDVEQIKKIINNLSLKEKEELYLYYSQRNVTLQESIKRHKSEIDKMREKLYNDFKK